MKESKYTWIGLSLAVIIIILLSQCNSTLRSKIRACEDDCNGVDVIVRDTIIKADSVPYEVIREVPVPYAVHYRDTMLITDTVFILRDYYAWRYYSDTIFNDSSAFLAIYDSLSENRLQGRRVKFQNLRPQVIKETTYKEKELKLRLFAGGFIGGNMENFEAGLSAYAIPKNDNFIMGYHYDLSSKGHRISLGWKIKFTK